MIGNQSLLAKTKVVIIGGGPSGSAAAIWCAKHGLNVTLIEAAKFPRNCPGEALHPGIEIIFKQLGVYDTVRKAKFLRYFGLRVKWDNLEQKLVQFGVGNSGPLFGYQALRAELDRILLDEAHKQGAIVAQPNRANEVIVESNRVVGVKTSNGKFYSDFVIDSSGSSHWLARKLNLTLTKYSRPLIAFYGYLKGEYTPLDEFPTFVALVDGWLWTCKIRENLYQWIRLGLYKETIAGDWRPAEFLGLQPTQPTSGVDVTWRRVISPSGSGYYIVGDAATVVDPASSHGVLRALMSGMKAAEMIVQVSSHKVSPRIAQQTYNRWLLNWFFYDVLELKKLYKRHPYNFLDS